PGAASASTRTRQPVNRRTDPSSHSTSPSTGALPWTSTPAALRSSNVTRRARSMALPSQAFVQRGEDRHLTRITDEVVTHVVHHVPDGDVSVRVGETERSSVAAMTERVRVRSEQTLLARKDVNDRPLPQ